MSGFDSNQLLRMLMQTGGAVGGGLIGGPPGAAAGGAIGGAAGGALFADDQKHGMAQSPQQGASGGPALQILQQLQGQMQAEEQQRQQAIMALLQQYSMPQQTIMPGAVQMESRR